MSDAPGASSLSAFTVQGIQASEKAEYEALSKARAAGPESKRAQSAAIKAVTEIRKVQEKKEAESEAAQVKAVITKIQRYVQAFPFLADKIPKLGPRASLVEAEEVLKIVREEMDSQRSLLNVHRYVDNGFGILGGVWGDGAKMTFLPPQLRLNLKGIDELHRKGLFRESLEPILQEIDIEYPWIGRQGLMLRALGALTEALLKTHLINTNPELRKVMGLDKEPPKEVPGLDKL